MNGSGSPNLLRAARMGRFGAVFGLALSMLSTVPACEVGLGRAADVPGSPTKEGPDDLLSRLDLVAIAPSVLVHTSYRDLPNVGIFPSNGLLLCTAGEGGLVDTAWSDDATKRLLDEAVARGCPIKHALFTHSHDDRTGGLAVLFARGVRVWATAETTRLLAHPGFAPDPLEPPTRVRLGGLDVDVLFPGPAHAPDNLVVHVPAHRVLFGGCMIKSGDAKSLGNVKDASLAEWPAAVSRVSERFAKETTLVVPGHGAHGGVALLGHTTDLLRKAALRAQP